MHRVKPYQTKTQTGKVIDGYFSGFVGKFTTTTTDQTGKTFAVLTNGPVSAMFLPNEIEPATSR